MRLALHVVIILIWEKAGIYVKAITLVWMGLAVFEYIYIYIIILNLQDIKRIEYKRRYWNNRERKKLEKQEVKCELYNGNILAGNQVMILNEDWIRLEIQENTDILVKILKCKDVRKVETIHK